MSFIPNYPAAALDPDQAEPDSGDFEILLAGTHGDGVLSGCAVTENAFPLTLPDLAGWWDPADITSLYGKLAAA